MNDDNGGTVRLESCGKTFADGTRALEPLSLEIESGETVVFLGPSGCGKTTTLRIIAGLESPDPGGRVFIAGEEVTALPVERRQVGMVFQSYALFPNMRVWENVAYGLKVRGLGRRERRAQAEQMLAMMQIEALAERHVDQLSGGQRQRVALARALAIRPRVLLLDEPLTALDAILREQLRIEIDTLLNRLGITAIYVTHDQAEAMALGDRIVVMQAGRIAQIGSPRDVYFSPQTSFVADFIGTMNRLEGRREGDTLQLPGGSLMLGEGAPAAASLALFRPEAAALGPPESASLRGRVANRLFLGAQQRLVIEGATRRPLVLERPGHEVFELGQEVGLTIPTSSLIYLD